MLKKYLILLFLILACAQAASANTKLDIDRIKITADGRELLSTTGSSGSINVRPGDELSIEIRLENTFDDDTDMRIKEIVVTARIEDIDDGDDVSDRTDRLYIRADSRRTARLRLDIPDDASSYQDYDLEIKASGHDENNTEHEDETMIDLEVDREEHRLVLNRLWVNDVACDGYAAVRLELENTGEEYEEDVELYITSPELGTLFRDRFDLPSINDQDTNIYRKEKRLDVPMLSPGLNTITVMAEYDDKEETLEKSINFRVEDCRTPAQAALDREEKIIRTTEPYSNPGRDTTSLFGDQDKVEVVLPDIADRAPKVPTPPPRESGFSTFVLFLANIAMIAFIILIVRAKDQ